MKTKTKKIYICKNCNAKITKWIGKCPHCGEWNSLSEEILIKEKKNNYSLKNLKPQLISEISGEDEKRIDTKNQEFNRVLGGGLVLGSLILIGGEPGIGKSTLALQIALKLKNLKILYISGEESILQIKLRAERLKLENNNCYFLNETSLEVIFQVLKNFSAELIIIDSIQTLQSNKLESSAGSISQIRECASEILYFAKASSIPTLLIGHINKDGNIAGPKVLEHIVDTVLQFEGDTNYMYRILRSIKNRFGSTSELGIFEMQSNGLREVNNPSELLLSQNEENLSGVAIASSIEGARPFLIEIQALVSSAAYGNPQRSSTGFDLRRLNMLLAVLEKKAGFRMSIKDVFLNIAGGINVKDPAIDLAVIVAILSSEEDMEVNKKICFTGEVGLTSEIRPVNRIEQRITEAEKLGFNTIYIPKYKKKNFNIKKFNIEIKEVSKVEEVFEILF